MTPKAEVQRRLRERRKLGLVAVTIGDDREPEGVRRGAVSTQRARQIIEWMEGNDEGIVDRQRQTGLRPQG